MRFIQAFALVPFLETLVGLMSAFFLGAAIGAERQYRQRTAGLRTTVLVSVGAAAFVDLAMRLAGADGAVRVIAYVVSGIGFLGAGVIMKEGMNVRGLNTAATLWCSAAVGACAGSNMVAEATLVTIFVIAGNTLLRPLVNAINRIPLNERALEATYEVVVTTQPGSLAATRDTLIDYLEAAQYPVSDVTTIERGEDTVEVIAKLISTAIERKELDHVVERLERLPAVSHATWESSTVD